MTQDLDQENVQDQEIVTDDNGDRHEEKVKEAFEGAKLKLDALRKEDGILAKMASSVGQQGVGVLQRAMSSVTDDNYRDLLLRCFNDLETARIGTAAIEERQRFGCKITPVLDRMHAEGSVTFGALMVEVFKALTHTTFTTNYQGKNRLKWWDRNKNGIDGGITTP